MISSRVICIYWGYKGRPQRTIWYFYRAVSITKIAQNCINFSQIDRETNCLNRCVCLQKGLKRTWGGGNPCMFSNQMCIYRFEVLIWVCVSILIRSN